MEKSLYFTAGRLAFLDNVSPSQCPIKSETKEYKEWHEGWEHQQDIYFLANPDKTGEIW